MNNIRFEILKDHSDQILLNGLPVGWSLNESENVDFLQVWLEEAVDDIVAAYVASNRITKIVYGKDGIEYEKETD